MAQRGKPRDRQTALPTKRERGKKRVSPLLPRPFLFFLLSQQKSNNLLLRLKKERKMGRRGDKKTSLPTYVTATIAREKES